MNSSDEDFQRSSASGTEPAGVTVPPRYGLPEEAGGENSVGVPITRAGVRMMSSFAPPPIQTIRRLRQDCVCVGTADTPVGLSSLKIFHVLSSSTAF